MLLTFLLPSATTGCQAGLKGAIGAVLPTHIGNEAIVEGEDAVTLQCLGEAIQDAFVQPLAVTCSACREGEQQLAMPCQQRRRQCAIADAISALWFALLWQLKHTSARGCATFQGLAAEA